MISATHSIPKEPDVSETIDVPAGSSTALARVETLNAVVAFAPGGIEKIISSIEQEVRATKRDHSTPAGRKAIKSLAFKVARSKTALDDLGKRANEGKRAEINAVDADRRIARDRLDALKTEVMAEVDAFEAAEEARIAGHEAALAAITAAASPEGEPSLRGIDDALESLDVLMQRDWREFSTRAQETAEASCTKLLGLRAATEQRIAEAAELARLRAEAEERARQEAIRLQAEREAQIAAEAAARAKQEAEALAEQERQRAERDRLAAIAKAEADAVALAGKVEADRIAAAATIEREQARAAKAEADRVAVIAKAEAGRIAEHERALASIGGMVADACSPFNGSGLIQHISKLIESMPELKRNWEEYQRRADDLISGGREQIAERLAVVLKNEQDRQQELEKERAEKAEIERQAAVSAEQKRAADAKAAQDAADAKRAANVAHRTAINRAVLAAFVGCGVSEELSKVIIASIARGEVPHVSISY